MTKRCDKDIRDLPRLVQIHWTSELITWRKIRHVHLAVYHALINGTVVRMWSKNTICWYPATWKDGSWNYVEPPELDLYFISIDVSEALGKAGTSTKVMELGKKI